MIQTFLYTVCFLFCLVVVHSFLLRILGQNQFMFWGLFYGLINITVVKLISLEQINYPFFLIIFICFWLMYLYFIGSLTRSISIHILSKIVEKNINDLSLEDIYNLYNSHQSLAVRLQAMEKNRLVKILNGKTIMLTKTGRIICLISIIVRRMFLTKNVG